MTDNDELRRLAPCPHCGSDRITVMNIRDGQQAVCKDCKSCGSPTFHGKDGFKATRGHAVEAWNRRHDALSAKAGEGVVKPVAWTGNGSLSALSGGMQGYIWPTCDDAHPIPLYGRLPPLGVPAMTEQNELRKLAELADRGEWFEYSEPEVGYTIGGVHVRDRESKYGSHYPIWDNPANTTFVAAASPDVILSLLDRIEALSPSPATAGVTGSAKVTPPIETAHPDNAAVDRFATAMKAKLAKKRAEGAGGWDDPEQCHIDYLVSLLVAQIHERAALDPVDIANLAMMIHERGETPSYGR
jgi:hypothetical protein